MTLKKLLHMKRGDKIVTAFGERAAGPGWANSPLWVIVRDGNGGLREECLQPREQPKAIADLYSVSCAVQAAVLKALNEQT